MNREPSPNDGFSVIGVTNDDDYRRGSSDLVSAFADTISRRDFQLTSAGIRVPDLVQVPVEIYSLSFTHYHLFAKYGSTTRIGLDATHYIRLYFLSDSVLAFASHYALNLPPILMRIRRAELPQERTAVVLRNMPIFPI